MGTCFRGHEARTGPFVCMPRTRAAEILCKLVHMKWTEAQQCVEAETVCKSSAHDGTSKTKFIWSLLHNAEIQTTKFRATCCEEQVLVCRSHLLHFFPPENLISQENFTKKMTFIVGHSIYQFDTTSTQSS